eukprot:Blabericola_migrator_1__8582@NODE_448_length_8373_cov_125_949193_g350_i0_p9_GENE_NODE_448_length_8373_cov_125_949193_g350_i0NODE_448_length_8373_cov_125_949193_g350_i0_p9_ORF_typecomplete_len123_score19_35C2/PF00168_30/2e15C2C2_1/PF11618_8/0_00094TruBC_2/PF09157_11/0_039DUF4625/PF15418_6/0_17DUF5110/PF17137_4/0_45_NODE_448_length_8373_cov_125_949193_g350_i0548916
MSMSSIQILVVNGRYLPRTSGVLDKTDPFVEVSCGGHRQRTSTVKNAGSSCTWNETLKLPHSNDPNLIFKLYDDDGKTSDFLGIGTIRLDKMLEAGRYNGEVNCTDTKGHTKGILQVQIVVQ